MLFRSIVLTLCLSLFCLGAVVGCAPAPSTGQPSAGALAPSAPPAPEAFPSVTTAPTDVPALDDQAPPSVTTPIGDGPDLSI